MCVKCVYLIMYISSYTYMYKYYIYFLGSIQETHKVDNIMQNPNGRRKYFRVYKFFMVFKIGQQSWQRPGFHPDHRGVLEDAH